MKKYYLLLLLAVVGYMGRAQTSLFREVDAAVLGTLNDREIRLLDQFKNNPYVTTTSFIETNLDALQQASLSFEIGGRTYNARKLPAAPADTHDDGQSWFGRLEDETGVFFSSLNNEMASKFYLDDVPCLIVPFRDKIHLLVFYNEKITQGECGTNPRDEKTKTAPLPNPKTGAGDLQLDGADDACTMRVLWVVTAQAEPEIPMNLELAARMLQDETNLAYAQSQINMRLEMARVVRTNHVESTASVSTTRYGLTFDAPTDLVNLSTGAGALSNIPALRDLYRADVVVMVRSQATGQNQLPNGIFGVALGVLIDPFSADANNGFALISTQFMIGGRFTFAHEIGHIQGARHDNINALTPVHAKGFVFSTGPINNRTIMAIGCGGTPSTGCRVQFFSNPNVSFNGTPVGVPGDRDNALRINQTATQILGMRTTHTNLLLGAETFDNEILARHLATQTISTNNSAVVAQAGSRVSMRAGGSVSMLPGFVANAGSVFSAYINTCSYLPTTDRMARDITATHTRDIVDENSVSPGRLLVTPNPSRDIINLKIPAHEKIVRIRILNQMGLQVYTGTPPAKQSLNISRLTPGAYVAEVKTDRNIYTAKFIKE